MKRRHFKGRYRSGLEKNIAEFLKTKQKKVRYEKLKIEWEDLRYRTYTPDFTLDNGIIIETKGVFDSEDRRKHLQVQKQHPELDIRFVFMKANGKVQGSGMTCAQWCDKYNFLYSETYIPKQWIDEPNPNKKESQHDRKVSLSA